jgi:ABC-type transport system involved in multi-copper enzyme maturation permease subunit
MIETIRSEYLKLRTTRTAGGLLAGLLLLCGLAMWGMLANATPAELATGLSTTDVLTPILAVVPVFVLVLGIRSFTDEVRHGSLVPTFLATPDRRRVLAAKIVVLAAASVIFALVALAFGTAGVLAFLAIKGVASPIAWGAIAALAGTALAVVAVWSALGVAIGALVRHQVAAIVGALAWVFIGEGLIATIAHGAANWLPGQAAAIALGIDPGRSQVFGAAVLVGWTVAATALAATTLTRRDVV